jgi:small-conductance mechanosensitive channel
VKWLREHRKYRQLSYREYERLHGYEPGSLFRLIMVVVVTIAMVRAWSLQRKRAEPLPPSLMLRWWVPLLHLAWRSLMVLGTLSWIGLAARTPGAGTILLAALFCVLLGSAVREWRQEPLRWMMRRAQLRRRRWRGYDAPAQ